MKKNKNYIKSIFQKFGKKHELIYSDSSDSSEIVIGGITNVKNKKDSHILQGVSSGHDVTIIQREVTSKLRKSYWAILQTTSDTSFPHLFIDGHRHDKHTYQSNFFTKAHYRKLNNQANSSFSKLFSVYSEPVHSQHVDYALIPKIIEILTVHGVGYDYEFEDNYLRIYSLNKISNEELEKMFILAQNIVHYIEELRLKD